MLPGFIIDQIRQREEEERAQRRFPQIELPLPVPEVPRVPEGHQDEPERGVVIIDLRAS